MELRRRSKREAKISYEHIPVNKVSLLEIIKIRNNDSLLLQICSLHEQQDISVPIQPVATSEDVEEYKEEIKYNSLGRREAYLMKQVQPELSDPSRIVTKLDLWFPCWNKCGERVTDCTVSLQSV